MGERTHLFINIEDVNGEQILGTVIQYQCGYGKTMPESALHIATNFETYRFSDASQDLYKKRLFEILEKYCDCKKPALTFMYRNSIKELIDAGDISRGQFNISTDKFEDLAKGPVRDAQKEDLGVTWVDDPVQILREAYRSTYTDFFDHCDNDHGLMFINIKMNEPVDSIDAYSLGDGEIKFGFGLTTNSFAEGSYWYSVTFDEFARQEINSEAISENFIEGYKLLLDSYGIEMMSPNELKSRIEIF